MPRYRVQPIGTTTALKPRIIDMQDLCTTITSRTTIIPVIVLERLEHAVPLATALYEGGLTVLEITLRTPVALEAISLIKQALPNALVGAGTVVCTEQIAALNKLPVDFMVSPGVTPGVLDAVEQQPIPLLPGAATASEAMHLAERGYSLMKFFPAEAAGGLAMLNSLYGPLPQIKFCPTGGINGNNVNNYLDSKNVACVGGSWMLPHHLIEAGDWQGVKQSVSDAVVSVSRANRNHWIL